jgi:hypothetical protein
MERARLDCEIEQATRELDRQQKQTATTQRRLVDLAAERQLHDDEEFRAAAVSGGA